MKLPKGFGSAMIDAEVRVIANDVAREFGHDGPIETCRITEVDEFLPPNVTPNWRVTCLKAFRCEHTGAHRFAVMGVQEDGYYSVVILHEVGPQLWPHNVEECIEVPTKEIAQEHVYEEIVFPFVLRLRSLNRENFETFIAKCRAANEERR